MLGVYVKEYRPGNTSRVDIVGFNTDPDALKITLSAKEEVPGAALKYTTTGVLITEVKVIVIGNSCE
jgi:hypothetical protein